MKRKGAFLVELVILLPILFLILGWIWMLYKIVNTKQVVLMASRSAAQTAVTPNADNVTTMAMAGVWLTNPEGRGKAAARDVLEKNGLDPDKATIKYSAIPIPYTLDEGNVQSPGNKGRATVHAYFTDMLGGRNCSIRCHAQVFRPEVERVFDQDPTYRYTKYKVPTWMYVVRFTVEYPIEFPIVSGLIKAAGFDEVLGEGKIKATSAFPSPMPFVQHMVQTPPLYKAFTRIDLWAK